MIIGLATQLVPNLFVQIAVIMAIKVDFSGLTEMTYIVKCQGWKVRTEVVRIERSSLDGDITVTVSVDNVARLARSSSSSPSPR